MEFPKRNMHWIGLFILVHFNWPWVWLALSFFFFTTIALPLLLVELLHSLVSLLENQIFAIVMECLCVLWMYSCITLYILLILFMACTFYVGHWGFWCIHLFSVWLLLCSTVLPFGGSLFRPTGLLSFCYTHCKPHVMFLVWVHIPGHFWFSWL